MVALASLTEVQDQPFEMRIVQTTTLDQLSKENVGFVKIDVEGHEMEVLRGAELLLRRQRPTILIEIEERHRPGAIETACGLMASLGYAGFFVFDSRTHAIEDFRAEMQNEVELHRPIRRRDMRYVNNFFFAPSAAAADDLRGRIDRFLAAGGSGQEGRRAALNS
jgi:hypothetical protein